MYNNQKIHLVAFASKNLDRSAQRLSFQAIDSKFYDDINIFNEDYFDKDFKLLFNNLMKNKKKRGYGFWIWKPYFILEVFKKINYGDVVNYVDIGCHIIGKNKKRFDEYLDILFDKERWLLPFQYKKIKTISNKDYEYPELMEYKYTKSDLFNYFGCFNDKTITDTPQYWAGSFFIKKNEISTQFLQQWLDVFYKRFDLVDDTSSKIENHKDFIENRHDQSIFSILCKKNNLKSISAYECDWAMYNDKRTWDHNINSPILAKRDLKYNIFLRFFNRQTKNFKRIKRKLLERWLSG